MRNHLLTFAFGLLLAGMSPAHASSSCDMSAKEIASAEWEDLVDGWMAPGCAEVSKQIVDRIEAMIADPQALPEGVEPEDVAQMQLMLASARLREALWAADLTNARKQLGQLDEMRDRIRADLREPDAPDADAAEREDAEEMQQELEQWLLPAEAFAVLDTGRIQADVAPIEAPEPEWTIFRGKCGTPAMSFFYMTSIGISAADAYVAIGQPEHAVQALLKEQWIDGLSLGMAPPRLQAFAERAFGKGRHDEEIESALAGIRIEETPAGRYAHLPLYGLWLPVPLGIRTWDDSASKRFASGQEIAEYLRPLLLERESSE